MHVKTRLAAAVIAGALASTVACGLAVPAAAFGDAWSYETGPLEAANATNAYLSVDNTSATDQTVNLGVFGAGYAGVEIDPGKTFTFKSDCTTSGGCLGTAIVGGSTPDLLPSFYYTPLGASDPTNVPAGGFVLGGPAGMLGDYLSADAAGLTSLENSATSQQTLLSTTDGQITGIVGSIGTQQILLGKTGDQITGLVGSVGTLQSSLNATGSDLGSVGSGVSTVVQSASSQRQIATLDAKVDALTSQVTKLTRLLTAKPAKPKRKRK